MHEEFKTTEPAHPSSFIKDICAQELSDKSEEIIRKIAKMKHSTIKLLANTQQRINYVDNKYKW